MPQFFNPFIRTGTFTIAKTWNQSKCPCRDDWIEKLWHIYSMEYYSAIKTIKNLAFDRKGKNMEDLLMSEAIQAMKERHYMSPLNIYRVSALYV